MEIYRAGAESKRDSDVMKRMQNALDDLFCASEALYEGFQVTHSERSADWHNLGDAISNARALLYPERVPA